MANTALLLDLDGVVLCHPHLAHRVSRRAAQYVAKTLHLTYRYGQLVNTALYTRHSHTLLGLRRLGYDASMEEFNDFVYNRRTLDAMRSMAGSGDMCKQAAELQVVLATCHALAIPAYIFSNAPAAWCKAALGCMGLEDQLSGIYYGEEATIKPHHNAYDNMEAELGYDKLFCFVDDTPSNLRAVQGRANWIPISFGKPFSGARVDDMAGLSQFLRQQLVDVTHVTRLKGPSHMGHPMKTTAC